MHWFLGSLLVKTVFFSCKFKWQGALCTLLAGTDTEAGPSSTSWKDLSPASRVRGREGLLENLMINSCEMHGSYCFSFLVQTQEVGCCSEQGKIALQHSSHFWPVNTHTRPHHIHPGVLPTLTTTNLEMCKHTMKEKRTENHFLWAGFS